MFSRYLHYTTAVHTSIITHLPDNLLPTQSNTVSGDEGKIHEVSPQILGNVEC